MTADDLVAGGTATTADGRNNLDAAFADQPAAVVDVADAAGVISATVGAGRSCVMVRFTDPPEVWVPQSADPSTRTDSVVAAHGTPPAESSRSPTRSGSTRPSAQRCVNLEPMLHRWRIADTEYVRHETRRGRRHAFAHLEAASTALVVVDMVPFFVEENPFSRGIVPNINDLAATLRAAGGCIAWVLPAPSPIETLREFYGEEVAATYQQSGADGPLHDRLADGLTADTDDLFVEKTAASAFFPDRCDLSKQLNQREIDTVIVAGTVANVCCESTVRDASTLGYRTIMVADANAAVRDEDLNATLHIVYRSFGDVRTTKELIQLLR